MIKKLILIVSVLFFSACGAGIRLGAPPASPQPAGNINPSPTIPTNSTPDTPPAIKAIVRTAPGTVRGVTSDGTITVSDPYFEAQINNLLDSLGGT